MSIEENVSYVRDRISAAASRSHREPAVIRLVCVTKNVPTEMIKKALAVGISDIGESRIQEAEKKFRQFAEAGISPTCHLIGHLQTNKAGKAVKMFELIQSVDSIRLAKEINRRAESIGKIQNCLLEVKVSEEESKYGCPPEALGELIEAAAGLKNIRILGLMTMPPFFDDPELARPYFRKAKDLYDKFYSSFSFPNPYSPFPILSMGMSGDFEVAIEEGSNMVRVGTAIFKD